MLDSTFSVHEIRAKWTVELAEDLRVLPRIVCIPTNGRTNAGDPCKTGIPATKWPLAAQAARPAGHDLFIV